MHTPSSGAPNGSGADEPTRPTDERLDDYRVDRRSFVAGTAAVLTTAGLAGSGAVSAQESVTVSADLADAEIDGGETTELSVTLSEVPADGLYGVTVNLDVDGSVAKFTGAASWASQWTFTAFDTGKHDDMTTGSLILTDAQGNQEPGATNVDLGTVELQGLGEGETEIGLEVQSIQDTNEQEISAETSTATLSVTGSGEFTPVSDGSGDDGSGDDGATDGGSGDDGGAADDASVDPGPQDDGDDASGDDGSMGGDGSAGDDGSPGFGVAAAVTALAAGLGARLRATAADDGEN